MKIDGSCLCGRITYDAEIDPEHVVICHCTDCQTSSGGPYRANVRAKGEQLNLRGEPATYTKIAESGNERVLAFCPTCGSHLFSRAPDSTGYFMLRIGAIKQRAQLAPKVQGWCRSALPWAMDVRAIPQLPKQ